MRIRVVSGSPGPGGGMAYALGVSRTMAARGHDVEVWAPARPGRRSFRAAGVDLRAVSVPEAGEGSPDGRMRGVARALADALAESPPADVHHAHDPPSALALLALRRGGRPEPVVRTVHHVALRDVPALEEMERASIQEADAVACVSAYWAERLRAEFGTRATVVPTGVDAGRFAGRAPGASSAAGLGPGSRPVVLAVGGVARRKGSRVLLEAFARARTRLGEGALLAVAGRSPDRDSDYRAAFREDARRLGLVVGGPRAGAGDAVALLGEVAEDDMPALYRAARVLACPSTREGFGMAALEAAAAGLPAVVSDLAVFREHFTDGVDCLMAPVGDSGPLAAALVRAMRDEALRATLREGARAAAARHTWDAAADAQERMYAALLERG